jgi:acetolactate synthase regulatory subunit
LNEVVSMRSPSPTGALLYSLGATLLFAACDGPRDARVAARAPAETDVLHGQAAAAGPVADSVAPVDLMSVSAPSGVIGGSGRPATFGRRGAPASATKQTPSAPLVVQQQDVTPGSMLVRVGQASLQVDSLEVGLARVREVARRTNAVIANTSMQTGRQETRAATLELRVPSQRFDEAVNGLSPIGKVESVNVSVEDVGEEYVDMQARMANARRLEERLVELLATRTGKLSDVLSVERELARVREEIERYEGRLRYLRTRASVSTLNIAMHEPYPIVADHPGAHPIGDAFVQAWRNLVGVTAAIIASFGVIVPLGLLIGALVLIGRRILPLRVPRLEKHGPESA